MAGPGGRIAPDGRPAQAPGVGKNARRHDLEAPATPGLSNSDLQQGDVQRLEQAQKIAPRPKRQQKSAGTQPRPQNRRGSDGKSGGMQVPDPIQFAGQKVGGGIPSPNSAPGLVVDPRPWLPLLEQFATRPVTNPKIAAAYVDNIAALRRQPLGAQANFIDLNDADDILERS